MRKASSLSGSIFLDCHRDSSQPQASEAKEEGLSCRHPYHCHVQATSHTELACQDARHLHCLPSSWNATAVAWTRMLKMLVVVEMHSIERSMIEAAAAAHDTAVAAAWIDKGCENDSNGGVAETCRMNPWYSHSWAGLGLHFAWQNEVADKMAHCHLMQHRPSIF